MGLQENLTRLRHERNLSQEELAEQLGVSRQTVSRWEVGTVIPTADNLLALGTLYGVSVEELVDGKVEEGSAVRQGEKADPVKDMPSEPPKPKEKRKLKGQFLLAVIGLTAAFPLIFLWGELTNSRTSAAFLLELLGTCTLIVIAVCSLYKLLYLLFKALR